MERDVSVLDAVGCKLSYLLVVEFQLSSTFATELISFIQTVKVSKADTRDALSPTPLTQGIEDIRTQ